MADEERRYYVYEWFIKDTNEIFYVGKGSGRRYKTVNEHDRNRFFCAVYKKNECDVRIVEDKLTEDEAFAKEKELIRYYKENTDFHLTNLTDGGEGFGGFHLTEEQMAKNMAPILFINPKNSETKFPN